MKKTSIQKTVLILFVCVLFIAADCFILDYSMLSIEEIFSRPFFPTLINCCVVAAFCALLSLLWGRAIPALMASLFICTALSLINCYTYALHSSPLRASEIASLSTALSVLDRFRFRLLKNASLIVVLFCFLFLIGLLINRRVSSRHPLKVRIISLVGFFSSLCLLFYSFSTAKWRPEIGFSWQYAVQTHGYPACLIEDTIRFSSCIIEPEGYTLEAVDDIATEYIREDEIISSYQYPDIILILNETFYDPRVCKSLALKTDNEFLSNFYKYEGVLRGQAIVPSGGTNASEYELLTSNSCYLINASAPFNFLHLKGANSIVSYLKSLGYETWAMHHMPSTNYSRNTGYADLGFDHILFDADFNHDDVYGNRYRTDEADYLELIDRYESSQDGPRFLFMLTYQNHGGWEKNDASYDVVHTTSDLGDLTDDMDEFLTSIYMSDKALSSVIDYFESSDRNVVIIMVGDHFPAFMNELTAVKTIKDYYQYILTRSTPYIVWCNYKELPEEYPYVTLTDLVPITLKNVGIPLSPYYCELLKLQTNAPIRYGSLAFHGDGTLLADMNTPIDKSIMSRYLYLEYNNLQNDETRRDDLFQP